MNQKRLKQLIKLEEEGGLDCSKMRKSHLNFLNSFFYIILGQFDSAKSDEELEKIFKRYVTVIGYNPIKEDFKDLIKTGMDLERRKFENMSLSEQGKYIQNDLLKYQRHYTFKSDGKIKNIKIDDMLFSRHMMN